jgi:hypothetical protein
MKKGMLKIGVDKVAQASYENRVKDKKQSFNALLEHIKHFVSIDEIDFTTSDLTSEITIKVLDNYREQFPTILKDEKILDLLDFQHHKVSALVQRFKSIDVEFDVNTKESPDKDFSIYTQNQAQVDEWFIVSSLVDELNKNLNRISQGLINRQQLSSLIGNVTFYDAVENRFKANIRYILSL